MLLDFSLILDMFSVDVFFYLFGSFGFLGLFYCLRKLVFGR